MIQAAITLTIGAIVLILWILQFAYNEGHEAAKQRSELCADFCEANHGGASHEARTGGWSSVPVCVCTNGISVTMPWRPKL